MLLDIIAGARPNFVKIAPIIRALRRREADGGALRFRLIHTGQHYGARMSGDFFEQLGLPDPDINLEVGSDSPAAQTGAIMVRYEAVLSTRRPNATLVVGDVNSTMACAIVAQKFGVPVGHVEAGIRSGDWQMPEEINRLVTDAITNWYFTTSEYANDNLRRAGISDDRIFFVGNTMIDTLLAHMEHLQKPQFWADEDLRPGGYLVLTLHRPANVDNVHTLSRLLDATGKAAGDLPVILPIHPRTAKTASMLPNVPHNIRIVEPQAYLQFNYLVKNSKAVVTDSGGITEEATVMHVPCITLRDSTERPETVSIGTNELVGGDVEALCRAIDKVLQGKWKKGAIPPKWDGDAGKRIVAALEELLCH